MELYFSGDLSVCVQIATSRVNPEFIAAQHCWHQVFHHHLLPQERSTVNDIELAYIGAIGCFEDVSGTTEVVADVEIASLVYTCLRSFVVIKD